MKSIIYLKKGKAWLGDKLYEWTFENLSDVFAAIKRDQRVGDLRIVLGMDLGFVVDFKIDDVSEAKRENIFRIAKGWMPFSLSDECFDWKLITLGESDLWIQVVAVDPTLLIALTNAISKSGLNVEWMIPAAIVLGTMSLDKEMPVVIKWKGKEEMTLLAQKGLVDLVGNNSDDEINKYAREKWGLEVNPEQLILNDTNFDFGAVTLSGRNKGSDVEVLALNLLKKQISSIEDFLPKSLAEKTELGDSVGGIEKKADKDKTVQTIDAGSKVDMKLIGLLGISFMLMLGILAWQFWFNKPVVPAKPVLKSDSIKVLVKQIEVATSGADILNQISFSSLKALVQNGSGVAGEAGKVKEALIGAGFVNVDTSNADEPAVLTKVSRKALIDEDNLAKITKIIEKYEIGDVVTLPENSEYDLIIVIGSSVK